MYFLKAILIVSYHEILQAAKAMAMKKKSKWGTDCSCCEPSKIKVTFKLWPNLMNRDDVKAWLRSLSFQAKVERACPAAKRLQQMVDEEAAR